MLIGSEEFITNHLSIFVKEIGILQDTIAELEETQIAFSLLRACAGASKMVYKLRTTPSGSTVKSWSQFDNHTTTTLRTIIGGILPEETMRVLSLPLKTEAPSFGAGLTRCTVISFSAFLASNALVEHILRQLIPNLPGQEDADVLHAHSIWGPKTAEAWTIHQIFDDVKTQRQLTACVHAQTLRELPTGDDRTRIFRSSLNLRGAKDWPKCQPSTRLGAFIRDRHFRMWLKYYCRVPLFIPDTVCPRKGCSAVIDTHGDHLIQCGYGFAFDSCPRTRRHNAQVMLVVMALKKAARNPIVEPPAPGRPSRPDIASLGTAGGSDFIDVTFVIRSRRADWHSQSQLPPCSLRHTPRRHALTRDSWKDQQRARS